MTGSLPPAGICPGCGQVAGGERCIHCGVAVRVGPYRVRQVLGLRGAARTYLADDVDGLVVLKELSFSTEPSAATLRAFHQEARQLQSLTHPRIPRYLDMLQLGLGADTRLYLAQEFIEGTPLENELAGRHYTELEARELARQILDILRYLQSRSPQVFHGDLKPANLIRRSDGALFLVDFGAAWVRGGASPEASRYTPPEQSSGELDATTDLFALGVTLVDSLSWEPAWKHTGAGPEENLASRLDVEPGFREFISRLTSSDPGLRFASADVALRELDAPAQVTFPLGRRMRPMAVGTGAALLIFGAGLATGRATKPAVIVERAVTAPIPCTTPTTSPRALPPPQIIVPPPPGAPRIVSMDASDMESASAVPPLTPLKERWEPGHKPRHCELAWRAPASDSGHWDTGVAAAAFDHDPATAWRSAQSNGAWLQVDLGRNHILDALVVDWAWDTNFGPNAQSTVLISQDGAQWTVLHTMINAPENNNVPHQVWFSPRAARYVRFVGTAWNGGWAHVRSLELYGPECLLTPSPMTAPAGGLKTDSNVEF